METGYEERENRYTQHPEIVSRRNYSMQYHLAQIKAFCDAHPIAAKVLIVPTMTVGHDLTLALAATGYSWLNLQIETPRSLAEKDAGALLIAEGHSRMAQDADLFWLDEMIPQIVSEVKDDYFAQQGSRAHAPFSAHIARSACRGTGTRLPFREGPAASAIAPTLPDVLRDL